ncbi:MAG: hypothetical protein KIG16_01155 [Eubacteriales bacterium]|nr:hypothetical protein [Eubacteriales bacterium]
MSKNDLVAVLYFDDTQVVGRVAKVSYGQNITPITTVRKDYSGIMDGQFNDRNDFTTTVNAVVAEMVQGLNRVPQTLYIGVANQFCQVQTQTSELVFDHMTKINRQHLQKLWENTQFDTTNMEIIHKQALYYKLEEYEEVLIDVLGTATIGVTMVSSATTVNQEFRYLFDLNAIQRAGFLNYQFVSVAACELFMIPEKVRDAGCTLVRCDFFSTSVANVLGDGLMQLAHFNLGSGYLVSEIMDYFNFDYETAIKLLAQCTPTFEVLVEEKYTANGIQIPASIFNKLVMDRLNEFAKRLSNFENARVIYLSGGNFDQIYGARNVFANVCDRTMYECADVLTGEVAYPENTLNAIVRYVLR